MERSGASNTFTAHSGPYNRDEIHAHALAKLALSYFGDDLRTHSGASGFPSGERGAGTAESTARTVQMITISNKKRLGVCGEGAGRHSLLVGKL